MNRANHQGHCKLSPITGLPARARTNPEPPPRGRVWLLIAQTLQAPPQAGRTVTQPAEVSGLLGNQLNAMQRQWERER